MAHRYDTDGNDAPTPLLTNQACTLEALTTAASVLDAEFLADARRVADATIEHLHDEDSFVDGPAEGVGLLDRQLRPLDANVAFADALIDLAELVDGTADDEDADASEDVDRYREYARETLEAFAGASDRFGVQIARYATAVSRLLEGPLAIRVATEPGSDLHRAALRLADHEKVVVPDATSLEAGTARVERGDHVSESAETPAELSERVQAVLD